MLICFTNQIQISVFLNNIIRMQKIRFLSFSYQLLLQIVGQIVHLDHFILLYCFQEDIHIQKQLPVFRFSWVLNIYGVFKIFTMISALRLQQLVDELKAGAVAYEMWGMNQITQNVYLTLFQIPVNQIIAPIGCLDVDSKITQLFDICRKRSAIDFNIIYLLQ